MMCGYNGSLHTSMWKALAGRMHRGHPNNPLPLSKRRTVTAWDASGLVPIADGFGASLQQ